MRIASQVNQMVIIPDFTAMADGLTFTVGQIIWTTGLDNFAAMTAEEAQIQSASIASSPTSATTPITLATALTNPATSLTTLTTCCPHPSHKGRQIDNADLLGLSTKLFSLLAPTTCHVAIMMPRRTALRQLRLPS